MHFFNRVKKKKERSLSLISPPLLYPSIQMGAARDERISLYWTWLNAVLMKAHADNSFFIMSLAGLGISFSVAGREKFWFPPPPPPPPLLWLGASSFDWSLIVCLLYYFLYCISARLSSGRDGEVCRVWWIVFTPKNRCLRLRKNQSEAAVWDQILPCNSCCFDTTVIHHEFRTIILYYNIIDHHFNLLMKRWLPDFIKHLH